MATAANGDTHGGAVATFDIFQDLAFGGTSQAIIATQTGNPLAQGLAGELTEGILGASAEAIGLAKVEYDTAAFGGALAYRGATQGK